MKKYFKIAILTFLVVGLMSGSAFAAASLNAGNTTLAAEKIRPAVAYTAAAVNTAYQPAGAVALSTVVRVSLTNGTFTAGSNLDICNGSVAMNLVAGVVGALTPTYVDMILTTPMASGTVYTFSSGVAGVSDACASAPVGLTTINVGAGSPAGTTVTMSVTNAGNAADPNLLASATVLNVVNQFSAVLAKVTSKLNFATNMVSFIPAGAAVPYTPTLTQSEASINLFSDESINDKVVVAVGGGTCQRVLAAADGVSFKVTGNLTGILNIKQGVAAAPASIYPILAADRTAGFATLTILGNALTTALCNYPVVPVEVVTKAALELTAQNTTNAISAGVRTATVTLTGGGNVAAAYTRALLTNVDAFDIQLDATQIYIPLIKVATGTDTYIKLQSKTTVGGGNGINVQILASDGTLVAYSAGTITSGVPVTITGTQLAAAVVAAGKTVDGVAGFAAIVTVNTPNADVFAYANTCAGTDCKRIPAKVVYIAGATQIVE
jgi:hypothetical protein